MTASRRLCLLRSGAYITCDHCRFPATSQRGLPTYRNQALYGRGALFKKYLTPLLSRYLPQPIPLQGR